MLASQLEANLWAATLLQHLRFLPIFAHITLQTQSAPLQMEDPPEGLLAEHIFGKDIQYHPPSLDTVARSRSSLTCLSCRYGRQLLDDSRLDLQQNNDTSPDSSSRRSLVGSVQLREEEEYHSTTGAPPPGYKKWLEFAKARQCHLGPYRRIDKDLQACTK